MNEPSGGSPVRAMAFTLAAGGLGALSLAGLFVVVDRYEQAIAAAGVDDDRVMVLVAGRDLHQGIALTEEDLYAVQVPLQYVPDGVYLTPEHVVGRIPRERILANEFVRSERLANPERGSGLHAVIPKGKRAISVAIQDGPALSGFLEPGSFVDVLVTIKPTTEGAEPLTLTIQENTFVLGVNGLSGREEAPAEGAEAKKKKRSTPSVTLLATADQAEEIAHASNLGELHLSLRTMQDDTINGPSAGIGVCGLVPCPEEKAEFRPIVSPPPSRDPECVPQVQVKGESKSIRWFNERTGADCN